MKRLLIVMLLLILPSLGWGQAVIVGPQPAQPQIIEAQRTLKAAQPKELRLKIGEFEVLEPSKEAKQPLQFQYLSSKCFYLFRIKANTPVAYPGIRRGETEKRLHYFEAKPYEYAIVEAKTPGTEAVVVNRNGANKEQDPPEEIDRVQVLAGGVLPTPDPPKPDDKDPVVPIPGEGFRVLIVRETKDTLPASQVAIFSSTEVRNYLNQKTVLEGNQRAYRIWDKDTNVSLENETWKIAFNGVLNGDPKHDITKATSFPWVIITNGKDGYAGPLPKNVDEMMAKLKQFGGN